MTNPLAQVWDVRRVDAGGAGALEPDRIAVEEPLEIRLGGRPLVVIMRTPGADAALATGFLITEGIVGGVGDIVSIEPVAEADGRASANALDVTLAEGAMAGDDAFDRRFFASSSCGICGKASIEAVTRRVAPLGGRWKVAAQVLLGLPDALRARQAGFEATGSLHAAGLFDLEGGAIEVAEDVGRHNAVDKVAGRAAARGLLPADRAILAVSGRISFEIAQKALMAGVPAVVAISGATSLAVQLAEDQGMTLAGFAREGSMTVYHGAWRIEAGDANP